MTDDKLLPVPLTVEQIEWATKHLRGYLLDRGDDTGPNTRVAVEIVETMENTLFRQGAR